MSTLRLLFLLGVCLAATVAAREVSVSEYDIEALGKLLDKADLVEQEAEFDDEDGEDDDETRMWNPIKWIKNKLRNKCKCEGLSCECCFKLKVFRKSACFKAEVQEDKKLRVEFDVNDKSLVNKVFDVDRDSDVCGKVPVKALSFLNFCLNQQSQIAQDGTISYCSNVQFKVANSLGAIIQFKCLQLKDGHLTFNGYKEVKKSGMLVLKVKNPFKTALALFKKAAGKG